MSRTPLAIVFDLDGTLVDSRDDIVHAGLYVLERHGRPPKAPDTIASYVGDGARFFLSRLFEVDSGDARVDEFLATFLPYYADHAADRTKPMPGAEEALDALAGLSLALCTNKPRSATETVLRRLGWTGRFDVVLAAGDLPQNKPDPAPLFHVAERLHIPSTQLVMVGDAVQDIECGRRASARTIGVLGGFGTEAALAGARPDRIIAHLAALPGIIGEWTQAEGSAARQADPSPEW